MNIAVMVESIIIPNKGGEYKMQMPVGSTVGDIVKKLEEDGKTGNLKAEEVFNSHMFICNSRHVKIEEELHEGDRLMIIKTLLGG